MTNLSPAASIESVIPRSTIIDSESQSPDPEVIEIATRRQFSASEKRMLLAEADRCKERGELGAFLRRKRIYSSMLSSWRKQLDVADRTALAPQRRGPKPDAAARQIKHLNRDNARLRRRLSQVAKSSVRFDAHIPEPVAQRLREIANIANLVAEFFGGDAQKVCLWFEIASPMLGNVSPRDMIRLGRYKRLLNFVIDAREAEAATPR